MDTDSPAPAGCAPSDRYSLTAAHEARNVLQSSSRTTQLLTIGITYALGRTAAAGVSGKVKALRSVNSSSSAVPVTSCKHALCVLNQAMSSARGSAITTSELVVRVSGSGLERAVNPGFRCTYACGDTYMRVTHTLSCNELASQIRSSQIMLMFP